MQLSPMPQHQFLDDNGDPLAGGKLYSYQAGTSTPLDTYSDQSGTSNTNPLILDSGGRGDVWLDPTQSYKLTLTDADDNQIWSVDDIDYLPDSIVTTAKINNGAVTAAKLGTSAVETAKINDLAVTTAKLAGNAVTTAKITDANVTTAKLADGAVTNAKLGDANIETSSSSGSYSNATTSETDVTNLSDSITTTGRPVLISFQSDGSGSYSAIGSLVGVGTSSTETNLIGLFILYRDATEISTVLIRGTDTQGTYYNEFPPAILNHIDEPAAGTYTYKLTAKLNSTGAGDEVIVENVVMKLTEL